MAVTRKSIKAAYRGFLATREGMVAYNRFKEVLYGSRDSLSVRLSEEIKNRRSWFDRASLAVCDIGGGDGIRIRKILGSLKDSATFRNCSLDFVEQSSVMIEEFHPEDLADFVEVQKFNADFETWVAPSRYDIIFLIHSIFAFSTAAMIEKTISLARPDGLIVVLSNAEDSFLGGLKRILDDGFEDQRFEVSQVIQVLDRLGVPYETVFFPTRWSVAPGDELLNSELTINRWLSLNRFGALSSAQKLTLEQYFLKHSVLNGLRMEFEEEEVALFIRPKQQTR
jgi:hypothetical protein